MDLQAQDRAHRIGQTREVRVLRLLGSDTLEEDIHLRVRSFLRIRDIFFFWIACVICFGLEFVRGVLCAKAVSYGLL